MATRQESDHLVGICQRVADPPQPIKDRRYRHGGERAMLTHPRDPFTLRPRDSALDGRAPALEQGAQAGGNLHVIHAGFVEPRPAVAKSGWDTRYCLDIDVHVNIAMRNRMSERDCLGLGF